MLYSLQIVGALQELVVGIFWGVVDTGVMKGDMEPSTIPKSFGSKIVGAASFFSHPLGCYHVATQYIQVSSGAMYTFFFD